jgi:hypothetical protein
LDGQGAWLNTDTVCEDQRSGGASAAGVGAVVGGLFATAAAAALMFVIYSRIKAGGGEAYALKPNAMFRQGGSRFESLHDTKNNIFITQKTIFNSPHIFHCSQALMDRA